MDFSLVGVHTFLSTHTGRDQVGNFVQYVTQALAGGFAESLKSLSKDSPQYASVEANQIFYKKISLAVGNARRTVRWFASLAIIIALKKLMETGTCLWPNNPGAFVVAQVSLLFWHLTDNYRWLIMNQLIQGDSLKWKRISFSGFVLSSFVTSVYFANELFISPNEQLLKDKQKEQAAQRSLAKALLTLVAVLHISELYPTHEVVCGTCGALSAAIVIWETFPRKKKAE